LRRLSSDSTLVMVNGKQRHRAPLLPFKVVAYLTDDLFVLLEDYNIEVTDRIAQSSQISVDPADYEALKGLGVNNPELILAVTYFTNYFDTTT
jgi:hypothetical protein